MPYGCGHFWDNYATVRNGDEEMNRRMVKCKGGFEIKVDVTPKGEVTLLLRDGDREMASAILDTNHAQALELAIKAARTEADARRIGG